MTTIVFESHATTYDNEKGLSSGHYDVYLSPLGMSQSQDLGKRYLSDSFDAVYCSDLQRSYKTAVIAFDKRFPILCDKRLRECDYGLLTRKPKELVEPFKADHIKIPFPGGESYTDTTKRMKSFLRDLYNILPNGRVMIIGHRATQYGLEHLLNLKPLKQCVEAPWVWQPGWSYQLTDKILG